MTLKEVLFQAAQAHGIFNDYGIVKEAVPVIAGGSEQIFEHFRGLSSGKHTYDPVLVERCCCYLFGKAVEAVMVWGQTRDGKFSILYKMGHVVDMDLHPEVPSRYTSLVKEACAHGSVLFQAHMKWCEDRVRGGSGQFDLAAEVKELFLLCSLLGMSYALEKKYHELPGEDQGVVFCEPIYSAELREVAEMGLKYYQGKGVPRNLTEAFKYLLKAANGGHVSSQYAVGMMCFRGEGTKQDNALALQWFLKAAENGWPQAQHEASVFLCNGIGCKPDIKKSFDWCQKAAEQNVLDAIYALGVFLFNGAAGVQDRPRAIAYLRKAAERGNEDAQNALRQLNL